MWKKILRKIGWERRAPLERAIYVFMFLLFSCFAAFYIYLYLWGFMTGFKTHSDIVNNPFSLPEKWVFHNYIEIFSYLEVNGNNYFQMLFNSLYFSVLGPLIQLSVTSMFAYACCKYKFPCSKLFYPLILITMTLPIYGSGGSQYKVIKALGLIDSYMHIILAFAGMSSFFLYFTAIYTGVSNTYYEAAVLDGANEWQAYFKVMLPQAKNLFLALFLIMWEGEWNNYSGVLIYLPNIPTLAGGVYLCELDMVYDVRYDMIYAAYMVSAIPPLIIFACFSNVLTNSISLGGIKE